MHSNSLLAMNPSKLWTQPLRKRIIQSILSRENASTGKEILADFAKEERQKISYNLDVLVNGGILYRQDNYISKKGFFYSIYWGDLAQRAVEEVENPRPKGASKPVDETFLKVQAILEDAPELSAAEIGRQLNISRQAAWQQKKKVAQTA